MSDTTTTTVSDEPHPVSALEQALRDKFRLNIVGTWLFQEAADLVHERDAQLWALVKDLSKDAEVYGLMGGYHSQGQSVASTRATNALRAILEGKTS